MIDAPLPEGLQRLEEALARSPLPAPPQYLRELALGEVRRARAHERLGVLAAAAALAAAVIPLRLSMPHAGAASPPGIGSTASDLRELQAIESLGLDAASARRLARVLHAQAIPRLAPPIGSDATLPMAPEGL